MSSEVLFTALVGILFLDDPVNWRFFVGGFLIVGSGLVLNKLIVVEKNKPLGLIP